MKDTIPVRDDALFNLVFENMLLSRVSATGYRPKRRQIVLDRSAAVLLARLEAEPGMTVAELSDALGLDISTVHRQLAAAIAQGIITKDKAASGGAKVHFATEEGLELLQREFEGRCGTVEEVTQSWTDAEITEFARLMRKFNKDVEAMRGQPWPRPTDDAEKLGGTE